jgi:hypothetical protein
MPQSPDQLPYIWPHGNVNKPYIYNHLYQQSNIAIMSLYYDFLDNDKENKYVNQQGISRSHQ